jgi:hypothetical protein
MLNNKKHNLHKIPYLSTFEHTALLCYKLYQVDLNFVRLRYLK